MFDLGLVFGCFTHLNVAAVVRSKFLKSSSFEVAVFKVLLNTLLMLAQLELDGRAASVSLGLESGDFSAELGLLQAENLRV